jgi:protein-S-isoprenylcysteine O-methyltransferase Ste14
MWFKKFVVKRYLAGMLSLLLRNLFFTLLQPGVVAGLVPYLLLRSRWGVLMDMPFTILQYIGILLFATGLAIMLDCILRFALEGKGTLSPVDPTRELVASGLYRFSRNPMYVGVMLMLFGESVFSQSIYLSLYSLFIFILFNLFIILVEEPRLKRDFGDAYEQYSEKVRRWI